MHIETAPRPADSSNRSDLPRRASIALAVLIAAGAFTLSFNGLADLAAASGIPPALAWVWPLVVDGTIVAATIAVVAMPRSIYGWSVLALAALVSIAGNAAHAVQWGAVGIAVATVPPLFLLAVTHLTVHLARPTGVTSNRPSRPLYLASGHDPKAPDLARNWRESNTQTAA